METPCFVSLPEMLFAEMVCTEKNRQTKLCKKLERLCEEVKALPQLKKKVEEQDKLLASTNDSIVMLSRALKKHQDREQKASGADSEIAPHD